MYITSLGGWLWVIVAQEGMSAIGLAQVIDKNPIPQWVFWALGVSGLILGPFIAYHNLRLTYETKLQGIITEKKRAADGLNIQLSGFKKTKKRRNHLGKCLEECRRLLLEELAAQEQVEDWLRQVRRWREITHSYIRQNIGVSEAAIFDHIVYDPNEWLGTSISDSHRHGKLKLNCYHKNLSTILTSSNQFGVAQAVGGK